MNTNTKKPSEPTTTVYDQYLRNANGNDIYLTELAINKEFVDDGTYQAIVEQDGGKYFTDPQGVIVAIFGARTIVFKPKGSY